MPATDTTEWIKKRLDEIKHGEEYCSDDSVIKTLLTESKRR